jgi:alkylated DNA repair dioxygenase AlkB
VTAITIDEVLDLERFPLHAPASVARQALVRRCREQLDAGGMFTLDGFVRARAMTQIVADLSPVISTQAFTHRRRHNIYFKREVEGVHADHPVMREVETVNHTLCGDQLEGSAVIAIYEWPPLAQLIADVLGAAKLFTMADTLARANVMAYRHGEALNWHFDRSEFTVTLLLQEPHGGGEFQYCSDLRSDNDPNYEAVGRLIEGRHESVETLALSAGSLNVFKGRNTAHRVTPVEGDRERIIAVLSYYDAPGVMFSDEERVGFYGRAR